MKNGILELGLTIWVFIILVVLIILYYSLFGVIGGILSSRQEQVLIGDNLNTISLDLINLLRTPVEVEGESIEMRYLIVDSYNKNNGSRIEKALDEIFLESNLNHYLAVYSVSEYNEKGDRDFIDYLNEQSETIAAPPLGISIPGAVPQAAIQRLPNFNGDDLIIYFYLFEKKGDGN